MPSSTFGRCPGRALGLGVALLLFAAPRAQARQKQVVFSIDWQGPTISVQDASQGVPITEGDLLRVGQGEPGFAPLPPPAIRTRAGQLGLAGYGRCVGHPPGTPCGIEVDALSFGNDPRLDGEQPFRVLFAVDEYALGTQGAASGPSLATEGGLVGDSAGDVWISLGFVQQPPIAPGSMGANTGLLDGDGRRSATGFVYPGLGIVEPNRPDFALPDDGDRIDALDVGPPHPPDALVYFSLDAAFLDPLTMIPNSGSAQSEGVRPGDVLVAQPLAAAFQVYASAAQLGLDLAGPGTDDLDALILAENGVPGFQPSEVPYDWLGPGGRDMLLFSVRRGSALIGQLDSIFGAPIVEGDLLTTPLGAGLGPATPGIFIPAEALGIETNRTVPGATSGDVGAGDIEIEPYKDCNGNGRDDSVDIAVGSSSDVNLNGIPDECEIRPDEYCYCSTGTCANPDGAAGCANSTGSGGHLLAIGSAGVTVDDLVLSSSSLPANQFGLFYMGPSQTQLPFGDGQRCVGQGAVGIFRFPVQHSGPSGSLLRGPGIAASSCASFPSAGCITAGATWNFQCWYRDPGGPCGSAFNLTNGVSISFTP